MLPCPPLKSVQYELAHREDGQLASHAEESNPLRRLSLGTRKPLFLALIIHSLGTLEGLLPLPWVLWMYLQALFPQIWHTDIFI